MVTRVPRPSGSRVNRTSLAPVMLMPTRRNSDVGASTALTDVQSRRTNGPAPMAWCSFAPTAGHVSSWSRTRDVPTTNRG